MTEIGALVFCTIRPAANAIWNGPRKRIFSFSSNLVVCIAKRIALAFIPQREFSVIELKWYYSVEQLTVLWARVN